MKKNLLITGTSKGLGQELVKHFSSEYQIIGISRTRSEVPLFLEIQKDFTNFSDFGSICEEIGEKVSKLDAIILNAGVGFFGEYERGSDEAYKKIIELNLLGPILFLKKILPRIKKGGKIIFIGSIISKKFMKYGAVYQASKFGLRGFAGALKNELKNQKVHIINPKILKTGFHNSAKIELSFPEKSETKMSDICIVIKNILNNIETRFEIDL